MKVLLDTHTFLWWDSEGDKLSRRVANLLQHPETVLFLSVASIWELQIKSSLGKIVTRKPLPILVQEQVQVNGIRMLQIAKEHVFGLERLPPHHKDPFDRLLVSQAIVEDLAVVTVDDMIAQYPIAVIW